MELLQELSCLPRHRKKLLLRGCHAAASVRARITSSAIFPARILQTLRLWLFRRSIPAAGHPARGRGPAFPMCSPMLSSMGRPMHYSCVPVMRCSGNGYGIRYVPGNIMHLAIIHASRLGKLQRFVIIFSFYHLYLKADSDAENRRLGLSFIY